MGEQSEQSCHFDLKVSIMSFLDICFESKWNKKKIMKNAIQKVLFQHLLVEISIVIYGKSITNNVTKNITI